MPKKSDNPDSDIKIFGKPKSPSPKSKSELPPSENTTSFETQNLVAVLRREKRYGNIARAKKTASSIAEFAVSYVKKIDIPQDEKTDIYPQCCCLVAFGIVSGLEKYIQNEILLRVALNSFYDELNSIDSEFYSFLNNLTAMSFYYLASHHPETLSQNVALTFASLCKKTEDDSFVTLGVACFEDTVAFTRKELIKNNLLKTEN